MSSKVIDEMTIDEIFKLAASELEFLPAVPEVREAFSEAFLNYILFTI